MTKSIQLLGLIAFLFAFNTEVNAQTLHEEMFEKFGTLTEWMNSPLINRYIVTNDELDQKFHGLLGETTLGTDKIIPLGKVVKGKNVILLYFVASYTAEGNLDFSSLHSATLNKKTGEKTGFEKHLLAAGTRGTSRYNGSYKLKEKGVIVFSQNEVNIETDKETVTVKEYVFGKDLEYVQTID